MQGATSANLKEEGKILDLIALFMLIHENSGNVSIFCLKILVGVSISCEALFFNFPNEHFLKMRHFIFAVFSNCKKDKLYISKWL